MTEHRGEKEAFVSHTDRARRWIPHTRLSCETQAACEGEESIGEEKGATERDGEHQHGAAAAAAGARVAPPGPPNRRRPGSERRRGPEPGHRVQDEKCHRLRAAVPAGERPEHHAQSVGLRAQAAVLGPERLPRRRSGGGRPGKHRAALLRLG